jgi:hypothetical protein
MSKPTTKPHQTTVDPVISDGAMGKRDSATISAIFSTSPIHDGSLTNDERRGYYQDEVLDAVINDEGHTFGTYDSSYKNAPSFDDVETGGGGLPASPWVPNPNSPGPGSQNPTDQADPPDGYGQKPGDTWGTGVGSQLSAKASSDKISGQTLGDYQLGKSSPADA